MQIISIQNQRDLISSGFLFYRSHTHTHPEARRWQRINWPLTGLTLCGRGDRFFSLAVRFGQVHLSELCLFSNAWFWPFQGRHLEGWCDWTETVYHATAGQVCGDFANVTLNVVFPLNSWTTLTALGACDETCPFYPSRVVGCPRI